MISNLHFSKNINCFQKVKNLLRQNILKQHQVSFVCTSLSGEHCVGKELSTKSVWWTLFWKETVYKSVWQTPCGKGTDLGSGMWWCRSGPACSCLLCPRRSNPSWALHLGELFHLEQPPTMCALVLQLPSVATIQRTQLKASIHSAGTPSVSLYMYVTLGQGFFSPFQN